ncbi:uncharacterized protein LACBIDRAFT_302492 [Laccaria bicolor S238N-H82]|uniref:Predicted protein n=1 Tax=Laccaria bicolor (strain S238N-H82 / ATCC MYA-4686) TaxID=486041 RepID=B0DHS0_LACBS|nr:uncharacterized protein LACBIDRAFT_302492 [Laccaria bicolor S238N-H82]EDR05777.1 predicted protein [Laccaria bicolor S238N-H82]|eukprot:XP_001883453.1 predicted protein [Laccaria bicolor S238N-H82]
MKCDDRGEVEAGRPSTNAARPPLRPQASAGPRLGLRISQAPPHSDWVRRNLASSTWIYLPGWRSSSQFDNFNMIWDCIIT